MSTSTAVANQYQQALDRLRRQGGKAPLLRRMSELIALLDLTAALNAGLPREGVLNAALAIVLRAMQAARGALFVRCDDGSFAIRASSGLPAGAPSTLGIDLVAKDLSVPGPVEAVTQHGLVLLCPVHFSGRTIAVIGLGPRTGGGAYGEEDRAFLRSAASCAAAPIENGLVHEELGRLN